jgi:hypothetical protein
MPAAKAFHGQAGPTSSAIAVSGLTSPYTPTTEVFEYSGGSWTAGTSTPVDVGSGGIAIGTQTATLSLNNSVVLLYDGSTWTSGTSMNTPSTLHSGSGTQTSAVKMTGSNPGGYITNVELYDGTAWTAATAIPVASHGGIGTPAGSQGSAYHSAGYNGSVLATTYEYQGAYVKNIKTITVS